MNNVLSAFDTGRAHFDDEGRFIHRCHCGAHAPFGYGVNLRARQAWHLVLRPAQTNTQNDFPGASAATLAIRQFYWREPKERGTVKMKQAIAKTETQTQLTLGDEDKNILDAAKEEGFERLMKFLDGRTNNKWYLIQDDVVPLGTEFLAHVAAWTKAWTKFVDGELVENKRYLVARGEKPPEREELDDLDEALWPKREGKPNDPWVFQHLLPMENLETGEVVIFVTRSIGGRIAVSDLAEEYSKQRIAKRKLGQHGGQPIVQLAWTEMKTRHGTKVPRPLFKIVGWDEAEADREGVPETSLTEITSANDDDMKDEIPF